MILVTIVRVVNQFYPAPDGKIDFGGWVKFRDNTKTRTMAYFGRTYHIRFSDYHLLCGLWLVAAYSMVRPRFAVALFRFLGETVHMVLNVLGIYVMVVILVDMVDKLV